MVVFGTRPELIKLAPVMAEARRRSPQVELIVCSTGQHKEMLAQAMAVFDITPDEDLALMQANQTLADLTARLMTGMDQALRKHQPDVVVVQGDTTTAFVSALTAFYRGIPVAHVEAGLRTGDLTSPFPEEGNRLLIARLAHWHFAPTAQAAKQLLGEGVNKERVQITGNTVVDAIEMMKAKWVNKPYSGEATQLFPGQQLVLITTHRRENFGEGLQNICQASRQLSQAHPEHVFVFPVHLNPNVRKVVLRELEGIKNLQLISPVDFEVSLYLQSRARLILTDSGGIQEEAPSFGVPTLVLREHTERGEGITAGYATLVGTSVHAIITAAEKYLVDATGLQSLKLKPNPYGDGLASQRIVNALLGHQVEPFNG
jgi:UDP-N-acetylglucosamine 2-epimerase (non-hydrolysing)